MKAICPVCGTPFFRRTKKHVFCKRKCFKTNYNKRLKEESSSSAFPSFLCSECNRLTKLDFNPKKNILEWSGFFCPYCNYKNNINY